ncbi:regulator of G-protein signaling 12 [Hypomesus transpacificus]|uniref:regulator of G-protein signaling 12 n=1 Tax=Hypomesus transpacificus TaxID=137520 RepID=UPI001F078012|nr:regulator of G-protein signaling 12 [Hypomesus transpacificus]XP_046904814.1 regulator of G-protein signaling 12 [Hypomesus transpacificus]
MKMLAQPAGARRRLELNSLNELRGVDVVRGRTGYGFTISGRGPCLLSGILEGSPADEVGLKQGDRIMSVNGTDVSKASHEAVVQLIGTCKGPLHLVVLVRPQLESIGSDEDFSRTDTKGLSPKRSVIRTVSDNSGNSPCKSVHGTPAKQRPVSEPDMSHWAQTWNSTPLPHREEETPGGGNTDCVFTDPDDADADWSILNMLVVVGYLGSTELALNMTDSEDTCLQVIRGRIRQLGTEQDTHKLVLMKIMFDCIRLCDDAGAVLAAFPAENLILGSVCAEDRRFFCLVTTANITNGHILESGPVKASCHVFFIDPDLAHHGLHLGVAGRFGFDCTPDPDVLGCLEFPQTPQSILHFVSVLYSDMGAAVEKLRARLDQEAHQQTQNDGRGSKKGSGSSNGDSGIGNASPPEERADRDFPVAPRNDPGGHLPSCPWDYLSGEEPSRPMQNGHHRNPESSLHSLSESLPGPDSLTSLYGGPPPRLEFQFKPPPPPLPLGKKQNFLVGPLRSSQKWFSVKQRWPKGRNGDPEVQAVSTQSWSGCSSNTGVLPPPMYQIPAGRYQSAEAMAIMMLPPRQVPQRGEWTQKVFNGEQQSGKYRKDGNMRSSRFWGIGVGRASARRSFGNKRMSLARSLDDLESAASSDGDYGGSVQLQGCCSQSSLNSNGSLPGAGAHRRLSERRVASWAACFERLLQDPLGVRYFSEFLKKEFSEENILFWQACEYFSHVPATDKKQLSQRAGEIYNSFLSSKATTPVNIDSQAQLADDVLTSPRPDMFMTQQLQIFNLMKFDSYSRFLKSSLYQECMLAEVEGRSLPDPYQIPCSPAPSKHSASSDRSNLSTPKKDGRKHRSGRSLTEDSKDESADKKRGIFFSWSRNRSFGKGPKKKDIGEINLDFWGSNGRRESQGSLSSGASMELATSLSAGKIEADNRHSLASWDRVRECPARHCSVALSDGSCSSVALRPGASIREVLQDLCHSLHINMAAVDLFLVGGEKPLVLDQDCMTLSSRELRLERRTLFRLDLVPINRSVGLKAKPTKPVTEVLRPVVAKYGLHLSDLVATISGETQPLDLGAPISSLDGLRVVLDKVETASGKDKSKTGSSKSHAPTLASRSQSATGDERSSGKDLSLRASGPDASLPVEKRKQKKINIDEAEEFFELLSRAQSCRANDQRGLLSKEDLVLPDFLRLAPPSSAAADLACSTPTALKQPQGPGRENGLGGATRGPLHSNLRSESLDSSLSSGSNGHSGGRRALLPLPRHHHGPFGGGLSPIPRPSEPRAGLLLRTLEEDTHADLTLVGEGDISSPNSTLLPPSPAPPPSLEVSLAEANFTPPSPCSHSQAGCCDGKSPSEGGTDECTPKRGPQEAYKRPPSLGALPSQTATEVMDVEGVRLEEGAKERTVRAQGEDSELSLSFQGYAAELRQCQSKMKNSQLPHSVRNQPEDKDSQADIYKATIV